MINIRKIDYYGQLLLSVIMILSIPFLFYFGVLAGLFILGCWQLISAGLNTAAFIHADLRKQTMKYWKWTGLDLLVIFLCWPLSEWFDPDDLQVALWIAVCCAVPLAVYYWRIYFNLITHLELRKELSGFTKSKL